VCAYPCRCAAADVLLAEHLELAWQLYERESKLETSALLDLHTDTAARDVCDTLSSGCEGPCPVAAEGDGAFVPNQWPLPTLLLMLTSCYLCLCLSSGDTAAGGASPRDVDGRAMRLFDILTRLPQNTHAVDAVQARAAGRAQELRQRRVGLALFLTASAMNHSCDPNCYVRFPNAADSSAGARRGGAVSPAPARFALEVVALRAVRAGEELTLSYGVAAGQHAYSVRQQALRRQYLFRCACGACSSGAGPHTAALSETDQNMLLEIEKKIGTYMDALRGRQGPDRAADSLLDAALTELRARYGEALGRGAVDGDVWRIRIAQLQCSVLDARAYALAMRGGYALAAAQVARAIGLLLENRIYGEGDVPMGREYLKLSELHAAAGGAEAARAFAARAKACLAGVVSESDPDLQALRQTYPEFGP
jgi:hypothetical protein